MTGLWGGRFEEDQDAFFKRFNASFPFDQRLIAYDIQGSFAYCQALLQAGVIDTTECTLITQGLKDILKDMESNQDMINQCLYEYEDVHEFVETNLGRNIGDAAKKLHTGRSRNDQVATDFRLFARSSIDELVEQISDLQKTILNRAEQEQSVILPGFTHLQKAQAITWSHFLMSYFEMLGRDKERLLDARKRVNVLPLGSGALAGNNYPIDRDFLAEQLGFDTISRNSLDATSDRDFVVEILSGLSLTMVHLSRLAEDLIIYSSSEYGYVQMSDQVSTGSSLMPQKKNPDALELIRGKSGRVNGSLVAMLTTLKGLPSCYNKDLQEDKEGLFDSIDTVYGCLRVMGTVVKTMKINPEKMLDACKSGYLNATDLADYLVARGVAFREAHHIVGQVVLQAGRDELAIEEMELSSLQSFSPVIEADVYECLSPHAMVAAKKTMGSTAPNLVGKAINAAKATLAANH